VEPEQGVAKSNWLYAVPSDKLTSPCLPDSLFVVGLLTWAVSVENVEVALPLLTHSRTFFFETDFVLGICNANAI
jgi:hypothetical protein